VTTEVVPIGALYTLASKVSSPCAYMSIKESQASVSTCISISVIKTNRSQYRFEFEKEKKEKEL
jgi:hypothetical protein